MVNDTIQVSRETCGGYMSENCLSFLRQYADVFAAFEGDNTVLLQLAAKGCGRTVIWSAVPGKTR